MRIIKNAESKVLSAIDIGKELDVKSDLVSWTRLLADIRNLNGDFKGANDALEDYIKVKQELSEQNSTEVIAEMEARFQTEKKQLEIDNLQAKGEIQELALEHEHNQRLWVTLGLILSILLIILVGMALLQKRKG